MKYFVTYLEKPVVAQPIVVEEPKTEDGTKKKGIFKKFTGETKPTAASVNVEEEYFPSLGEEPKNPPPKKRVEPVNTNQSTSNSSPQPSSGGVRKFMNAKKQGGGESFAPLDPELSEKLPPIPVKVEGSNPDSVSVRKSPEGFGQKTEGHGQKHEGGFPAKTEGGFSRRTDPVGQVTPVTEDTPADTKFKFGGEGPRKFQGANKISFKREEEKSEQEVSHIFLKGQIFNFLCLMMLSL